MGKLLTKQQAAEMTGLTRQTIQNWIDKGALNCIVIGKAHFLDSSVIEALSDEMKDVESTRSKLNELKLEYESKQKEITSKIAGLKELLSLFDDDELSPIRKRFYITYPSMLQYVGIISENEKDVLDDIIKGYSIDSICKTKNLTILQIKDIAKRAINNISRLRNYIVQFNTLRASNNNLLEELNDAHQTIELMKNELNRLSSYRYQNDSIDKFEEDYHLYKLLKSKLIDMNFSTRLQTVFKDNHIETLGELVAYTEHDLRQIKGLGKTCLEELKDTFESLNLWFGCNVDMVRDNYFIYLADIREHCKELIPILNTNLEDTDLYQKWYYENLILNNVVTIGDLASKYFFQIRNIVGIDIDQFDLCDLLEKEIESFLKSYGLHLNFNVEVIYREYDLMKTCR